MYFQNESTEDGAMYQDALSDPDIDAELEIWRKKLAAVTKESETLNQELQALEKRSPSSVEYIIEALQSYEQNFLHELFQGFAYCFLVWFDQMEKLNSKDRYGDPPVCFVAQRKENCILKLRIRCAFDSQSTPETSWSDEAYLLFPVHLDGTLLDSAKAMKAKKELYSTSDVLQIFRQPFNCVKKSNPHLCAGLKHMHSFDPPYAHNNVKPGNVLITNRKGQPPLAILMDFGSARSAIRQIRSPAKALQLQVLLLSLPSCM
ncbi:hypothetical protein L6164_013328 [Bauhinia variegata]|uniref:Uncharacterized protein n=1 Tax=Bauhinia variegata TaxID=167791 RepID=A0ACB9PFI6_BAUVA|nr:hypothetical protein L6164_013328 [Bauhinia variegata]